MPARSLAPVRSHGHLCPNGGTTVNYLDHRRTRIGIDPDFINLLMAILLVNLEEGHEPGQFAGLSAQLF